MRLAVAAVLDVLQQVWFFFVRGLRAAGACWCAGHVPLDSEDDRAPSGHAWSRTRDALVCWRAADGLAKIERFLDAQSKP